jgi:pyruvate dehydrogenase E2 component (dihydrolipoamide acetyltransferase)
MEVEIRTKIAVITLPDEPGPEQAKKPPWPEQETAHSMKSVHPPGPATGPGERTLPPERQNRIFASPRARRLAERAGVPLAEIKATGPQQMLVERDVKAYLAWQKSRPPATPVARRMAEEAGFDLTTLTPEPPKTRISRAEVAAALASSEAKDSERRQWVDLSPTRRTIAQRLVESQRSAAQVTLTRQVDATGLVTLREQIGQELSPDDLRPTYTDFLMTIVVRQLKQHPYLNATTTGGRLALSQAVHLGIAVDTERGLVVPVVHDAGRKGLLQLAQERANLVRRALDGLITPIEMSGGTFTLTNLGPWGVDAFTPIINPPQLAILGIGRIRSGPAVYQGELCVRQLMYLSLTFDHRFIDGAPAARFLADIVQLIEKPYLRWLEPISS